LNSRSIKLQYTFRLYLNDASGRRVLGKGGAEILDAISEYGSILAAAKNLGMSYKFVWDYLVRMQKRLDHPVIVTHRGGADPCKKRGGGGTALTPLGRALLREFESTQHLIRNTLSGKNKMLTLQRVTFTHRNRTRLGRKLGSQQARSTS